jgi:predicted ATPase/DNA-binding SARP family transcriptional activator
MLRLFLFGSPRLEHDGVALPLRRKKALALIAYLAVTGRVYSRESILALLWSEFSDADARNNMRRELSYLRTILGEEVLATDRQQIAWREEANSWVDVAAFTRQVAAVRAHAHTASLCDACAQILTAAVRLAEAELFDGYHLTDSPAFEEWLFYQRENLRQQLDWALEALVGWHSERGEIQPALACARRWLSLDPLNEPPRRALMQLLAHAGQHVAALRQYEEATRLLKSELSVTPEAATIELYEAIKARTFVPLHSSVVAPQRPAPALAQAAGAPLHAPTQPSSTTFVGRQDEIAILVARLTDPACRLLTLVGPGGIGKTCLANQVVAHAAARFRNGAQFVPLSSTILPDQIPYAVASALGLSLLGQADGWLSLATVLSEREQILVLDNVEQLVDAAPALARLLHAAPRLKLLVTSREALGIPEEWRWTVSGLQLSAEGDATDLAKADAVQLFLAWAQQHGAAVAEDALDAVAQICRLVGGMPLAIELAAAWTATLSCQEIADAIVGNLDLLATRLHTVPERHRSVQIIFDQTWARLATPLQLSLARLSVFPAGCTREAAAAIADAPLLLLSELIEHALLQRSADGRYLLHPLVRQYAVRRLHESPEESHAVTAACGYYYTQWLCDQFAHLQGGGAIAAALAVRAERDNLRSLFPAILTYASGEPLRQVLQVVQSIYFTSGPYQEGVALLEAAEAHLHTSIATPEREVVRAHVLTSLGTFAMRQGRLETARDYLMASSELFAASGALPLAGDATDPEILLGMLAMVAGDYRAAGRYAERVRARNEATGQQRNQAYGWYIRAEAAQAQGLLTAARTAARKALALAHASGANWFTASIRNLLGQLAAALGHYEEADSHYQQSYATREAFYDHEGMAAALLGMGEIATLRGQHERAAQRYGEGLAHYAHTGDRGGAARARLRFSTALAACGDNGADWRELQGALAEAHAIDFKHVVLDALVQAAALLIANERVADAVAPLARAIVHPASRNETTWQAEALLGRCEELLPARVFTAEVARGRETALDALVEELLAVSTPSAH